MSDAQETASYIQITYRLSVNHHILFATRYGAQAILLALRNSSQYLDAEQRYAMPRSTISSLPLPHSFLQHALIKNGKLT